MVSQNVFFGVGYDRALGDNQRYIEWSWHLFSHQPPVPTTSLHITSNPPTVQNQWHIEYCCTVLNGCFRFFFDKSDILSCTYLWPTYWTRLQDRWFQQSNIFVVWPLSSLKWSSDLICTFWLILTCPVLEICHTSPLFAELSFQAGRGGMLGCVWAKVSLASVSPAAI